LIIAEDVETAQYILVNHEKVEKFNKTNCILFIDEPTVDAHLPEGKITC
jgi:hypothetical protein